MRKLLYILISILILSFVMSCGRSVDKRLVLADSLMWIAPDSSLAILNAINRDSLQGDENQAYHALLLTQAQFRCNGHCASDSLINTAINHYSDNHNREHYTRALLYKGAYYEFNTNQPVEAMRYYKMAEENADTTDYRNLAQLNFRMGLIYHDSYISTGEDISKFKKSLHYYRTIGLKKNMMLCLLYIGEKLRVSNNPEAVAVLQQAKQIAIELKDTVSIVNATECIVKNYIYNENYEHAHRLAQSCITSFPNHLNEDIILDEVRACALLRKLDSVKVYLTLLNIKDIRDFKEIDDSQVYKLYTLADVALAEGDHDLYIMNKQAADSICEAIQIKRDSLSLIQAESSFNEHKIKQVTSQNSLFIIIVWLLIALFVVSSVSLGWLYFKKKKEWNNLIKEHESVNNDLIERNIKMSNVNNECKLAIYDLLKKIDSWVKLHQTSSDSFFATKFEESFLIGKKKKQTRIESGDFWKNIQSLADATYGKDLKILEEKFPKLSKDDLYIIALKYLGFSYITIALCMGYKDKSYVNKKKDRIPKKLGLDMTFDEFLNSFKDKN